MMEVMVVSDLGQKLKEARLAKGLSLNDVQELTKIRKRYLEAIEAGDYKVLPGSFYVRAFIKTYAETVGIDPDELLAEHSDHVPATAQPEQTMEPVIQKRRSRSEVAQNAKWLSTALMWSFAVLILVVIYWYVSSYSKSDEVQNTPDDRKITQGQDATKPSNSNNTPSPNPATDNQDNGGQNNAGTEQPPAGQQDSDQDKTGTDESTPDNTTPEQPVGSIAVVEDGKDGSTTKFKVQNSGGKPVEVVITATGKSWLEVRKGDKKGEKLYYETVENGSEQKFEVGPEGLFIKSGASSNTSINVAGTVVTDGKNTSRIQLNLSDDTATDPSTLSGNTTSTPPTGLDQETSNSGE